MTTVDPNPFHYNINISAAGAFTHIDLEDEQGKTIWVKDYPGGIKSLQIPAAGLTPGCYFPRIDGTPYRLIKNEPIKRTLVARQAGSYHGLWDQAIRRCLTPDIFLAHRHLTGTGHKLPHHPHHLGGKFGPVLRPTSPGTRRQTH